MVGVDPNEGAGLLLSYKTDKGFTWPMTVADRGMLQDYRVTRQATFATIDADGLIASSVASGSMSDGGMEASVRRPHRLLRTVAFRN